MFSVVGTSRNSHFLVEFLDKIPIKKCSLPVCEVAHEGAKGIGEHVTELVEPLGLDVDNKRRLVELVVLPEVCEQHLLQNLLGELASWHTVLCLQPVLGHLVLDQRRTRVLAFSKMSGQKQSLFFNF